MKNKLLFLLLVLIANSTAFAQVANQPSVYDVCDDDVSDELAEFDLTIKNAEILGDQDPNDFSVTYYATEADASSGTNALPNLYTNSYNPQTIVVRVEELSTGNYDLTILDLRVRPNPTPSSDPENLELCDDTNSGDMIEIFDLTENEDYIVNGEVDITLSYYTSQQDAVMGTNAIANPTQHSNEDPDNIGTGITPQTIYVRAENTATGCYSLVAFDVIVNPLPVIPVTLPDYVICDEDTDGFSQFDFDTVMDPQIYGSQDPADFILSYHTTQAAAESGNNPIINTSNYTNGMQWAEDVYIHLENIANYCVTTRMFTIRVETAPEVNPDYDHILKSCEDLDENYQEINDGFTLFNLTSEDLEITDGEASWMVTYYETQADAEAGINAIDPATDYTNIEQGVQTLFAELTDTNTGCSSFTTVTLQVLPNPSPNSDPENLELCDDNNSGDMIEFFDLTENEGYILNNEGGVTLSYYTSQEDAVMGTNAIADATQYSNEDPENLGTGITPQTIYVRVENTESSFGSATGCYSLVTFDVIVNPLPVVPATIAPLIHCEINNDGFSYFDLESLTDEILGGQDPTINVVTYHNNQADADGGWNALSGYYQNQTNPQTIYVNVMNATNGCVNSGLTFDLIVNEAVQANPDGNLIVYELCDDNTEFDNDSTNDSVSFDLSTLNSAVLDGQDPNNYIVSYYASQADADAFQNALPLLYTNTVNPQVVFARVDTDNSLCYDTTTVNLIVNNCDGIVVNAFLDSNNNGVLDANESGFSNGYSTYEVNDDGIINTVTSSFGTFIIPYENDTNTYDITYSINSEYENCFTVSPSVFENVTATSGNTVTIDFPITDQMTCQDLAVYLVPSSDPRPGFNFNNSLELENLGSTVIPSGTVNFVNDPIVNYVSGTSESPELTVTPTTTGATVDFTNLLPGETRTVWFILDTPTIVDLGELVTNSAEYTTAANDIIASNDIATVTQEVVGSYDPNDIIESHGKEIVYNDFITTDEYLYYTIRFQNVGTAEAVNVRVENTVNALLDISTLEMLKSSHDVVMLKNENQLTWTFDNINLPAQAQDDLGSSGYVHFKIKPTDGYAVGSIIPNTAEIYFDFNAPVITNTFQTEFIEENLFVNEFDINSFTLYPNPATRVVNIKLNNALRGNASVELIDILGKVILRKSGTETLHLNVENLQAGLYFVTLKQNNSQTIRKLIIK